MLFRRLHGYSAVLRDTSILGRTNFFGATSHMKSRIALIALLLISACVSRGPTPSAPSDADLTDSKLLVRCNSKDQCDRWWRTAQVWVVKNSGYKVQIATDAILQTYNATPGKTSWAFQITRSPHLDGGEIIEIDGSCGLHSACSPVYETIVADFKRTVLGTR
jgi:hypothetical protein